METTINIGTHSNTFIVNLLIQSTVFLHSHRNEVADNKGSTTRILAVGLRNGHKRFLKRVTQSPVTRWVAFVSVDVGGS